MKNLSYKHEDKRYTGLLSEIDLMNLPRNIITIQKSIPPYIRVPNPYYGFMGILLLDIDTDRIQCHICGTWFKSLSAHLDIHEIDHKQYKTMFGLYMKEPLASLGTIRKMQSGRAKHKNKRHIISPDDREKSKGIIYEHGMTKEQFKNKFGTCEAQLKFRVDNFINQYGIFPTFRKDQKLDAVLRYRFGSTENAKRYFNYPIKIRK